MIGGIGFPSALDVVASVTSAQAADANYPLANLVDLVNIRRLWRAAASGAVTIDITFSAARSVRLVSLIQHNAPAGATLTASLWTSLPINPSTNPGGLAATQAVTVPASIAGYLQTTPILFPAAVNAVGVRLVLSATAVAWEAGGIDASGWWEWPDIMVPEERGFAPTSLITVQPGGVEDRTRQWAPRIQSGTRAVLTSDEIQTTAIDFQRMMGRSRPFVFVRDIANTARWPRETFLAKNDDTPTARIDDSETGPFSYRLREHLG